MERKVRLEGIVKDAHSHINGTTFGIIGSRMKFFVEPGVQAGPFRIDNGEFVEGEALGHIVDTGKFYRCVKEIKVYDDFGGRLLHTYSANLLKKG